MGIMAVLYIAFLVLAAVVSVYDAITGAVPRICFTLYFLFLLVYCAVFVPQSLLYRLAETAAVTAFFLVLRKTGGLGLADVWFAGLSAGTFPFFMWISAMILGCAAAAVFMFTERKKRAALLPFLGAGFAAVIIIEMFKGKTV